LTPVDQAVIEVRESSTLRGVQLADEEAAALNEAGRLLANQIRWDDDTRDRSVVRCTAGADGWSIQVGNVVGVVGFEDRTLQISPKIPIDHLLYLFTEAGALPRVGELVAAAREDETFPEVIVHWFLQAVHKLVRLGLHRDYQDTVSDEPTVRGQLQVPRTITNLYTGRLEFSCRFDDFTFDNPLNRTIAEALRRLQGIPNLSPEQGQQARGLLTEFPPVGPATTADLRARPDRNTLRYETPLQLARQIIHGTGRRPVAGKSRTTSFVIPTPGPVEQGIRTILQKRLPPHLRPHYGGETFAGGFRLEPDLVFGHQLAVGDVKYRLLDNQKWDRGHVFQLCTYAAAWKVERAVLIGFRNQTTPPEDLRLGAHHLIEISWTADPDSAADLQAKRLTEQVSEFLQ